MNRTATDQHTAMDPNQSASLLASVAATAMTGDCNGYSPIRDYALIGDCHGCALVSRTGSIDWCAFQRFDAAPALCRLLDKEKGGFLSIAPAGPFVAQRAYLEGTNVLHTVFTGPAGKLSLTDYMPIGRRPGAGIHDYTTLVAANLLIRTIECVAGEVVVDLAFRPSRDYARWPARLAVTPLGVFAEHGPALYAEANFSIDGDLALGQIRLTEGQRRTVILTPAPLNETLSADAIARLFDVTCAFWREWIAYCRYNGPSRELVRRSALALKLLTYAPTGAIIAAATTSLPEGLGGERNWDYRFCWLRDASFTLYALAVLGYSGEAVAFGRFLKLVCSKRPGEVQIMYGICGEMELGEQVLEHLEGYCGSRPVRIGNAAYQQRQADVYGEFVDWAHLMKALGHRLDDQERGLINWLVTSVAAHAHEPDQGLWEARGAPRHYVYGKMMSWVALDRGLELLGESHEWRALRDGLSEEILHRGVQDGHLVQAYDYPETDAALLLAPMLGFPINRDTLARSVAAIERELREGDYVKRYRAEDGIAGHEGAFLICSFWLVDAYLALDKQSEAQALFERLVAEANDVGLLAEEIDPATHAFLGNFPQAFTHLALIGNAIHLELCAKGGAAALAGTHADRARRAVGATFGWRALWEACKASGRVGRFWSSRRSILPAELARQSRAATLGNPAGDES